MKRNIIGVIKEVKNKIVRTYNNIISKVFLKSNSSKGELFFISSNEYLPEPLKKDEEERLVKAYEDGKDESARQELIERNLRLVVYIAKKFENTGINLEDIISIGTIGLIKGISTFKASKNIKLATYASKCIENEILMYIRKNNKTKSEVSLDVPLNTDWDGNELLLSDTIGTAEDNTFKDIEKETEGMMLKNIVGKLNVREKEIIELRFGLEGNKKELTQKEVADYLGISQSYISRIEKKIMKKLRRELVKIS